MAVICCHSGPRLFRWSERTVGAAKIQWKLATHYANSICAPASSSAPVVVYQIPRKTRVRFRGYLKRRSAENRWRVSDIRYLAASSITLHESGLTNDDTVNKKEEIRIFNRANANWRCSFSELMIYFMLYIYVYFAKLFSLKCSVYVSKIEDLILLFHSFWFFSKSMLVKCFSIINQFMQNQFWIKLVKLKNLALKWKQQVLAMFIFSIRSITLNSLDSTPSELYFTRSQNRKSNNTISNSWRHHLFAKKR